MTLFEAVVTLNREIERVAISEDYETLTKLDFIKREIINHICTKGKKWHDQRK